MAEPTVFILQGYVPITEHGFALPCYVREDGGNSWHVAVADVSGDKMSDIARFEHFIAGGVRLLEMPLWRRVAVGSQFQDVFLWRTRISVGGRHEVLTDVEDLMDEISWLAPLTAFDLAFDMGQDDAALVADTARRLREKLGVKGAEQALAETVIGHVARLRVRRWAAAGGWTDAVAASEPSLVRHLNGRFALRLGAETRRQLDAGSLTVPLAAEVRALAVAADLRLSEELERLAVGGYLPTPTEDPSVPRRRADFATLGEALDYAAQGVRGLNFHDARGALTRAYPYWELRTDAVSMAHRFTAAGVGQGDRVAILAKTGPEFAALFFGAVYVGAWPVPLPLPTSFGEQESYIDELQVQLAQCDPAMLLYPPGLEQIAAEAARTAGTIGIGWEEFTGREVVAGALPVTGAGDVAYLQCSSGSTRFPHCVVFTHQALLSSLAGHAHDTAIRPTDRCVSWLPWSHDIGLVGSLLSPVANQMSADFLRTEDFARRPLAWLDLISRTEATTISYSPTFGYDICSRRVSTQFMGGERFDLSRWRLAGNVSDMIRPDVMQAFVEAFGEAGFRASSFMPSYGLAEATLAVTLMPPGEGIRVELVEETELPGGEDRTDRPQRFRAIVNCGKPVRDMAVEVREEEGAVLPEGAIGKIWCKGPSVMVGYFRDAEATAACMTDGWLDTGDMGYMSDGYLYIVGRAKDMIIVNGKNHWPQDIEWAVEQLPGFKAGDIAAFAITTPNGEETPAVLVQCRSSDEAERTRLRDEIRERVRSVTGMNCVIELIPPRTLPRTSSGKLSRAKARNLYLAGEILPYDVQTAAA